MTTRHITRVRALRGGVAVATTLALSATVGGAAFAVWSSTGTGAGSAASGTIVALTTTAAPVTSAEAYPGGPAVGVELRVSNPNPVPVRITAVALDGARTVTASGGTGACTTPPVAVSATGLSITLAANATNVSVTVPSALTFGAAMASTCQGATITVPVVLTGQTS